MATFMSTVSAVFAAVLLMVEDLVELVTTSGNELMLIGIIVPLSFLGVNMFRKLLNL